MVCGKCKAEFASSKDAAKCSDCKLEFHASCCRIRTEAKLAKINRTTWRCDSCCQETGSQRSDTEDPVMEALKAIQREMAETRTSNTVSFSAINEKLSSVQQSLSNINTKLNCLEEKNQELEKECNLLKQANALLEKRVSALEQAEKEMQQYSRNANLEIRGIPLTANEDVHCILERLARALEVEYSKSAISVAHRLPAPKDTRFNPSIVVQFVSRTTRLLWLQAAKKKRTQTTDIEPSLRPGPVFVGEHLTHHNRTLLKYGKQRVKEGHLAFAWSRDGKVFVRRTATSPARRVFATQDIDGEAAPRTSAPPSSASSRHQ